MILVVALPVAGQAQVSLSLPQVQAEPGAQVALPLALTGAASPGIVSLSIRLTYPSVWLSFVEFRQGDLVRRAGFLGLANATTQAGLQTVALSLAGTQVLAGEGSLGELVLQVDTAAPPGAAALLTFTVDTRVNRGVPPVATVAGLVGLRRTPHAADLDDDGTVGMEDFFSFADCFGAKAGEAGYLFDCDLNLNGLVEFDDFFLFADRFGTRY